jgi:hypothetical protein
MAGLRTRLDTQFFFSIYRGDSDLIAQRRLSDIDNQIQDNIVPAPLKIGVLLDTDENIEVAGRPATRSNAPFTG